MRVERGLVARTEGGGDPRSLSSVSFLLPSEWHKHTQTYIDRVCEIFPKSKFSTAVSKFFAKTLVEHSHVCEAFVFEQAQIYPPQIALYKTFLKSGVI